MRKIVLLATMMLSAPLSAFGYSPPVPPPLTPRSIHGPVFEAERDRVRWLVRECWLNTGEARAYRQCVIKALPGYRLVTITDLRSFRLELDVNLCATKPIQSCQVNRKILP